MGKLADILRLPESIPPGGEAGILAHALADILRKLRDYVNQLIHQDGGTMCGDFSMIGDAVNRDLYLEAYGIVRPGISAKRARGTLGNPLAVQYSDILLFFGGRGYGATGWGALGFSDVAVVLRAAETFTDTAHGTYLALETTAIGELIRRQHARLNGLGDFGIDGKILVGTHAQLLADTEDCNLYRVAANAWKTDDSFDAASYKVSGAVGVSGTFTTTDGKTVTVTNGLIVSIV